MSIVHSLCPALNTIFHIYRLVSLALSEPKGPAQTYTLHNYQKRGQTKHWQRGTRKQARPVMVTLVLIACAGDRG